MGKKNVQNEAIKLYELPRDNGVKLLIKTDRAPVGEIFTFHHTDGMYSLSTADSDGKNLHLSVTTPLHRVGKFYEIKEENELA